MEEKIFEELKRLGIPRVYVITFDREGERHITEGIIGHKYNLAEECILFYLFKDSWTVKYIDKSGNVHPEYIGHYGFRLCVDDGKFAIYRHKEKIDSVAIDSNDFENSFDEAWAIIEEKSSEYHYDLYN